MRADDDGVRVGLLGLQNDRGQVQLVLREELRGHRRAPGLPELLRHHVGDGLPGLVVLGDDRHPGEAGRRVVDEEIDLDVVRDHQPERVGVHVILELRPGHDGHRDDLLLTDENVDRKIRRGPGRTDDQRDALLIDHLPGDLAGLRRIELVVPRHDLDLASEDAAALVELIDGDDHALSHVPADRGRGSGERGDQPDLDDDPRLRLLSLRDVPLLDARGGHKGHDDDSDSERPTEPTTHPTPPCLVYARCTRPVGDDSPSPTCASH